MSFEKDYAGVIIKFDYLEDEWNIWTEIDNKKYFTHTNFSPYLKTCLPKQIQFLMNNFESAINKIDADRYAITIDYIMGDCNIILMLETREYKLLLENEKLRSEMLLLNEIVMENEKLKAEVLRLTEIVANIRPEENKYDIENWVLEVYNEIVKTGIVYPIAIQTNKSWGWLYREDNLHMLNDIEFTNACKRIMPILEKNKPKSINILIKSNTIYLEGFPTLSSERKLDYQYLLKKDYSLVISTGSPNRHTLYLGDFHTYAKCHTGNKHTYQKIYGNRVKLE
jgi:hypothetical protein